MAAIEIHAFICREDNYAVLVHDADSHLTACIDAPDAGPILKALSQKGWPLTHLFITHRHGDHIAGLADLKAETDCQVIGPEAEAAKIPGLDVTVREADIVSFGVNPMHVLETPGHTAGHVSYHMPAAKLAFTGDTLFAMGCGRLFEGDAETMWASLCKLKALPPDTLIYCGHDYAAANARFALSVEPENAVLRDRARACAEWHAAGTPAPPSLLSLELQTNPFLRVGETGIRGALGLPDVPDWHVFGELRRRKNLA